MSENPNVEKDGFVTTLAQIERGNIVIELDEGLAEIVAAVQATGKKGKVTLTIDVKKISKGDDPAMEVKAEVKLTLPHRDRVSTIMYADHGLLVRSDPRQQEIKGLEPAPQPQRPATLHSIKPTPIIPTGGQP